LDFDRDIYGASVRLSFVKKLRDEKKFDAVDQLVAQMYCDVGAARAIFDSLNLKSVPAV
jgi:riboflavin kinase/FMN adenylyltransferase